MKNKNLFVKYKNSLTPISFNPLTPELNPSKQGCLLEFFTGDFKFYCTLLEKKSISHRLFLQI